MVTYTARVEVIGDQKLDGWVVYHGLPTQSVTVTHPTANDYWLIQDYSAGSGTPYERLSPTVSDTTAAANVIPIPTSADWSGFSS